MVGHLRRRLEIDFLRSLHQRIDHVGLTSPIELVPQQLIDLVPPRLRLDPCAHWRAPRRQVGDLRHVELAVIGERQRPRNRRGSHQQHVWPQAFCPQRGTLFYAKSVLLVDDDQTQLVESRVLLNERMRPDNQIRRATLDVCMKRVLLQARRAAGEHIHAEP